MTLNDLLEGVRVTKLYSAMYGKMVLTQDVSCGTYGMTPAGSNPGIFLSPCADGPERAPVY